MKRFIARHSPIFIFAGLCLVLAVVSPDFRSAGNVREVLGRTCVIGVMAGGELLVILSAGIDLSVGSVAALSGVVCATVMKSMAGAELPMVVTAGVLGGALTGLLCGCINGVLVTKGRIPPFIATLGMMMAARGVAFLVSGGLPISGLPAHFAWLGGTKMIDGAPVWWPPIVIAVMVTAVLAVTLTFTRLGRALYATGGNLQAARLSGINVDRVRTSAYATCGMLAGLGGVILASRTNIGVANAAEMYELYAIAGCVIGGASLMGGEGGAVAALAGALIMMVLWNFCNLEDINVYWQHVFIGVLIVALVFYDNYRKRKAGLLRE